MSVYFDAFDARFNTDQTLVRKCRKLYEGVDGQRFKVLPHVVLIVRSREVADSFTSDIEDVSLELQAYSKDFRTNGIDGMLTELVRVFDDAGLETSQIAIHALLRQRISGPVLDDGRYKARIEYRAVAMFKNNSPVVRAG